MITPTLEPELYRVMAAKAREMGGFVHALEGTEDHVHLAVSVPPKLAPAKFIGDVKGNCSYYVNHILKPDFDFTGRMNTESFLSASAISLRW